MINVKIKSRVISMMQYLIALMMILECRSVWCHIEGRGIISKGFVFLATVGILGLLFVRRKFNKKSLNRCIIFILFILLYGSLLSVIYEENFKELFVFLIKIIIAGLYIYLYNNKEMDYELLYKYENIMIGIAILSLSFWVMSGILGILPSTGSIHTNWTSSGDTKRIASYFGVYFETQKIRVLGMSPIVRNTAIFTEGPMCSFHFSLALLIENFLKEKKSIWKNLLLTIAILSTISTTGIVVVLLVYLILFLDKNASKIFNLIKTFIKPILIVLGGIAVYYLIKMKMESNSGSTRVDDFIAGYKAWMLNPVFGNGFGSTKYQLFISNFRSNNIGFSNSPMLILSQGGLCLFMLYIVSIFAALKKNIRDRKILYFYILFIFMISVTIVSYQMITIYLMLLFAISKKERRGKINA